MASLFYTSFLGMLVGYLYRLIVVFPNGSNVVDCYIQQQNYYRQQPLSTQLLFQIRTDISTEISLSLLHNINNKYNRRWKRQSFFTLKSSGNKNDEISTKIGTNEFSRIVPVDRVLFRQRGGMSSSIANEYNVNIEASDDECSKLAKRFEIHSLYQLQAAVCLRSYKDHRSRSTSASASTTSNSKDDVEVEGTVTATVTQRCVRTNEPFNTTMEFPIYCLVRPAIPVMGLVKLDMMNDLDDIDIEATKSTKKPKGTNEKGTSTSNNKKKKNYRDTGSSSSSSIIDDMDIQQLQRILEQSINSDNGSSNDNDLSIMDDEFIYSTGESGVFDIGELISQLFWLELDPYPKKPGTGPTKFSITG